MAHKTGRGADQFMVRMPEGMRDRIAAAAEANGRSMNAEIVLTLEMCYPEEPTLEELAKKVKQVLDGWTPASNVRDTRFDLMHHLKLLEKKLEAERKAAPKERK